MNIVANHHYYIVPGIVDAAKVHEDADRRRRDPRTRETSIVHYHLKNESCNAECVRYELV